MMGQGADITNEGEGIEAQEEKIELGVTQVETKPKKEYEHEVVSIREAVIKRIAQCGTNVKDKVIGVMVDEEVNRRAKILRAAVDKYNSLCNELKRMKPDVVQYDDEDNEIRAWSKDYRKKREDLVQQVKTMMDLVDGVLSVGADRSRWDKLESKCKGGQKE